MIKFVPVVVTIMTSISLDQVESMMSSSMIQIHRKIIHWSLVCLAVGIINDLDEYPTFWNRTELASISQGWIQSMQDMEARRADSIIPRIEFEFDVTPLLVVNTSYNYQ